MKNAKVSQVFLMLLVTNVFSLAIADNENQLPEPPFVASEFQRNAGNAITSLNTEIDRFLKKKEIIDLNYGLHIINFISDTEEVPLQSAEQQFIADFARMSCYPPYEGKLPECNTNNDKNSSRTYGFLRPSNIFDTYQEQSEEKALAAFAVKTMIDPLPTSQLNEILENGDLQDPSKQKNLANLLAAQGPITLAKNSLNEIIAKRTKFSSNSGSLMKIIQDESNRRLNQDWIQSVQNLPIRHLMLELLQLEAFKVWMEYHKFLQNERIEALIATLLAAQTNNMNKMSNQLENSLNDTKKSSEEAKAQLQQEQQSNNSSSSQKKKSDDDGSDLLKQMGASR